jgi:hypothetical protein
MTIRPVLRGVQLSGPYFAHFPKPVQKRDLTAQCDSKLQVLP